MFTAYFETLDVHIVRYCREQTRDRYDKRLLTHVCRIAVAKSVLYVNDQCVTASKLFILSASWLNRYIPRLWGIDGGDGVRPQWPLEVKEEVGNTCGADCKLQEVSSTHFFQKRYIQEQNWRTKLIGFSSAGVISAANQSLGVWSRLGKIKMFEISSCDYWCFDCASATMLRMRRRSSTVWGCSGNGEYEYVIIRQFS